MKELLDNHRLKHKKIKKRLSEFKKVFKKNDTVIFTELCFCVCTPQSKAVVCDKAIRELAGNGLLYSGNFSQIRTGLKGVRFPNNKARYIIFNRNLLLKNGRIRIKSKIISSDIISTREWLVKNVKGIGYKEASHFLRNIGFGQNISILDVHILKNLKKYGVIKKIPEVLPKKKYYSIEKKMRAFAKKINIPLDELDLLFWSNETGEIFK